MVSFSLMSITPLLGCCFLLFCYLQPGGATVWFISTIFLLLLLISLLGFYLMKDMISKFVRLAVAVEKMSTCTEIKIKDLAVSSEDEMGVLEAAINRLVWRLNEEKGEGKKWLRSRRG